MVIFAIRERAYWAIPTAPVLTRCSICSAILAGISGRMVLILSGKATIVIPNNASGIQIMDRIIIEIAGPLTLVRVLAAKGALLNSGGVLSEWKSPLSFGAPAKCGILCMVFHWFSSRSLICDDALSLPCSIHARISASVLGPYSFPSPPMIIYLLKFDLWWCFQCAVRPDRPLHYYRSWTCDLRCLKWH